MQNPRHPGSAAIGRPRAPNRGAAVQNAEPRATTAVRDARARTPLPAPRGSRRAISAIVRLMKTIASHRLMPLLIFVCAAALEVLGDATIRSGLRGRGLAVVGIGCLMLAAYGVVVNQLDLDFSRLMGAYVAIFAAVSVLIGRFAFHDRIRTSTWVGLAIILLGGAVIHFGVGD
jgi:drug/metabolite transporter superfamily protein YnfA